MARSEDDQTARTTTKKPVEGQTLDDLEAEVIKMEIEQDVTERNIRKLSQQIHDLGESFEQRETLMAQIEKLSKSASFRRLSPQQKLEKRRMLQASGVITSTNWEKVRNFVGEWGFITGNLSLYDREADFGIVSFDGEILPINITRADFAKGVNEDLMVEGCTILAQFDVVRRNPSYKNIIPLQQVEKNDIFNILTQNNAGRITAPDDLKDESNLEEQTPLLAIFKRADEIAAQTQRGRPAAGAEHTSKTAIRARIDDDVIEWLKDRNPQYTTQINAVLRALKEAEEDSTSPNLK